MRSYIKWMLSLSTILILAGIDFAAEIRGVISKVDPEKNELILEGKGKARGHSYTFSWNKDTRVLFGSERFTADDLTVNRKAVITFDERDNKNLALIIKVAGPKPEGRTLTVADGPAATVKLIALSEREIVVASPSGQGGESEKTYVVPKDAKITRDDRAIQFEDIKEGDQVVVDAETQNGKDVARSIRIGGKAPTAKKTDKKPEDVMKWVRTILQRVEQARQNRDQ
ncbi:MAG: hypothetical protein ACJ8FY_21115 [Gemmataceae bacterium]